MGHCRWDRMTRLMASHERNFFTFNTDNIAVTAVNIFIFRPCTVTIRISKNYEIQLKSSRHVYTAWPHVVKR